MFDSKDIPIDTWVWGMQQACAHLAEGFIDGRNVREGYIRTLARVHGGMERLAKDDIFRGAHDIARSRRSEVSSESLANIYFILKYHVNALEEPGNIVEFGSYNGGSAFFMAILAKIFCSNKHVFCLDTFDGLPATDSSRDYLRAGQFSGVDFNELHEAAARLGLDNITFIKGDIRETGPLVLQSIGKVALAHIDLDLYDPIKQAYDMVIRHMTPKGYIIFDDGLSPGCLGAFQAIEELVISRDGLRAEQTSPHLVYRAP